MKSIQENNNIHYEKKLKNKTYTFCLFFFSSLNIEGNDYIELARADLFAELQTTVRLFLICFAIKILLQSHSEHTLKSKLALN